MALKGFFNGNPTQESRQFEYVDDRPFTTEDRERIAAELSRSSRPYRAGSSTQKRAALFNTFLRSEGREGRRSLLGEMVAQLHGAGLSPDLSGILYSRASQVTFTRHTHLLSQTLTSAIVGYELYWPLINKLPGGCFFECR